jgi:hypothetical protein
MRCGGNHQENNCNEQQHNWFIGPMDKGIKMPSHPSAYIKEQEETP